MGQAKSAVCTCSIGSMYPTHPGRAICGRCTCFSVAHEKLTELSHNKGLAMNDACILAASSCRIMATVDKNLMNLTELLTCRGKCPLNRNPTSRWPLGPPKTSGALLVLPALTCSSLDFCFLISQGTLSDPVSWYIKQPRSAEFVLCCRHPGLVLSRCELAWRCPPDFHL